MRLGSIIVVLVEPLYAGNVGSVARVMKNMGLSRLVLVRPRCDPRSLDAIKMAAGARDLLAKARVVATLEEAIAPAHVVIGTSRREGRHRRAMLDPAGCAKLVAGLEKKQKVAILFGREDRGLTNEELVRCHYRVKIPSHRKAPSLNLAQAVAVVAYEMFAGFGSPSPSPLPKGERELRKFSPPLEPKGKRQIRKFPPPLGGGSGRGGAIIRMVSTRLLEPLYSHLEEALTAIGFLDKINPLRGMRIARGIFSRAGLTKGEVQFVRGICRQILWYSRSGADKT